MGKKKEPTMEDLQRQMEKNPFNIFALRSFLKAKRDRDILKDALSPRKSRRN